MQKSSYSVEDISSSCFPVKIFKSKEKDFEEFKCAIN